MCFLTYVRFNAGETTGRTNIKLGMIDHHPGVSVIRGLMTSQSKVVFSNIFF